MFSPAVTRHKQQTSGRLRTANNTIVKCFFQIHAPGKCFISSIMSKFWWYTFHRQHKPPSSPEQRIFPLIFIATIRQIPSLATSANAYLMSILSLVNTVWLTVFSPCAVTFSLGSLSTNWKYLHSQDASWNDFRGPSEQALPLPSRVSLACASSFLRPLLPSDCYAGYDLSSNKLCAKTDTKCKCSF